MHACSFLVTSIALSNVKGKHTLHWFSCTGFFSSEFNTYKVSIFKLLHSLLKCSTLLLTFLSHPLGYNHGRPPQTPTSVIQRQLVDRFGRHRGVPSGRSAPAPARHRCPVGRPSFCCYTKLSPGPQSGLTYGTAQNLSGNVLYKFAITTGSQRRPPNTQQSVLPSR